MVASLDGLHEELLKKLVEEFQMNPLKSSRNEFLKGTPEGAPGDIYEGVPEKNLQQFQKKGYFHSNPYGKMWSKLQVNFE